MEAARKELDIALLYFRFMQTICWSIVDFQRSVLSGCSHLIHLLPTQTGYLFCWGFFCHRSYDPRRTSQVPCAEYLACGLSITDTYFSVYVNRDLLIHPRPFTCVCVCVCVTPYLCLNSESVLLFCKLVSLYFFIHFA